MSENEMFTIALPTANLALVAAIGAALTAYGNGEAAAPLEVTTNAEVKPETKVLTTADIVKAVKADAGPAETAAADSNVVKLPSAKVQVTESSPNASPEVGHQEQSNAVGTLGADVADAATGASQPSGNDVGNVDEKGVGKNAEFCGNAAKPFNASGKKKGQWKKRQGVDEAAYDAWYAESLAGAMNVTGSEPDADINTASAFNGNGQQAGGPSIDTSAAFSQQQVEHVNGQVVDDGTSHQKEVSGALTFSNAGDYMKWQSEQQAAGLITTADVDSGYAATQTGIQDLFNPQTAADAVAKMYAFLAPIAAGQQ